MLKKQSHLVSRLLPLILILGAMAIVYFMGFHENFTLEVIQEKHKILKRWNDESPLLVPALFCLTYLTCTALSLPVGLFLSLIGGYLFPQPLSTILVVISATCGAAIIFLAARRAVRGLLRKKVGPFIKKMERGFQSHVVNYLLFLRFVPLVPFWVVNIVPSFFKVRLWTFVWTTAVGITPGSLVLTLAGRGIDKLLETEKELSFLHFFNVQIIAALSLLGALSIFSIWLRRGKKHKYHD